MQLGNRRPDGEFGYGSLQIFCGRAHPRLGAEICEYLRLEPGIVRLYNFSDGENYCQIDENVRGSDIFLVQPTCTPVNDTLMELLILIDAFKRSSASRITAVIPYYGYARQDRKDKPRVPISSKLVADLLTAAGADRILTMDLHAAQIQGFFDIPVDHLFAAPIIIDYFVRQAIEDLVIVSPDAGGVERARAFAKRLGAGLAIVDKRRFAKNETVVMNIIGEVSGMNALVIDDIVDTAGTLIKTVDALLEAGAKSVQAAGIHAVLSGPAIDRINESGITRLVVTDTMPLGEKLERCSKLVPLSVAELLGEAIRRIHEGASVSSLFV